MVFVAMFVINTEQRLRLLARVVALSIGFHALKIGLFVIRTGGQAAVFGPENSFLEANNSLGMALAMNVPFLFYIAKTDSILWVRRIAYLMLAFSYPAVIGTFSRGAWLGLAAASGSLVLKSKHRILSIVAAGVLTLSSPMWISYMTSEQISQRYDTLKNYEEDGSANSRFWNWTFCSRVGLANPLAGAGFNFYSPAAYQIYYPEFLEQYPGKVWSCHNTWLTMFAEHGLPGLFLWLSLLGSTLFGVRHLAAREGSQGRGAWLIDFSHMIQVSLVSYAVSSTFLDVGYYEGLYFVLVIAIAMKEVVRRYAEQVSTIPLSGIKLWIPSKTTVPSPIEGLLGRDVIAKQTEKG